MGMAATPAQVTTLEEFFALPEDNSHRHELLDGVYLVSQPPSYRHQVAVMELFRRLQPALADRPDLILFPVLGDIVLGPRSVVQPDLFIVPRPASAEVHWRDMAVPLLAIEVLSPGSAARDRGIKRQLYQHAAVPEYWIVDLDSRLVERWRPGDSRPEILREVLTWVVPGSHMPFELGLAEFFANLLGD
jgi:Uma2 family endonuclease